MKRILVVLLIFSLAISLMYAGGTQESSKDEKVTLTVWTHIEPGGDSGRAHSWQVIIDKFEHDNPDIDVVVEVQPWTEMSGKFMAAHASGNEPDVTQIQAQAVNQAIEAGVLEDLSPWIENWSQEDRDDFYLKDAWNNSVRGDSKYLFSLMNLAEILIYRQDLFDKYGIDSEMISNWEGFVEAAQQLTRDSDGDVLGSSGFDDNSVTHYGYGKWLARNSGAFVMVDRNMATIDGSRALNDDWTANWTTPTGVRAFSMWIELMQKGVRSKRDLTADLSTSDSYFASGSEAMHHLASFRIQGISDKASFDPDFIQGTSYPEIDGNPPSVETNSWSIGMSSNSEKKEAAWKFLEAVVSAESDLQWAKDTPGLLPARRSTLESDWFKSEEAAFTRAIAEAAARRSHLALTPPVPYLEYLVLAYHNVIAGQSIDKALQQAAEDYNKRLAEKQ